MSFVTNSLFLGLNTLQRSDGQYGTMRANQSLQSLSASANAKSNAQALLRTEQKITFGKLMDSLRAKVAEAQEESLKKQRDKNIKESFSTFA